MNQAGRIKVCMIVPDKDVKGGIASVVNGYRSYDFGMDFQMSYVESYCNGKKLRKFVKAVGGYIRFLRELCISRPDLVHIHSSFGPSFWRKLPFIYMADSRRIPIVNHIHGAEFEQFYINASDRKKKIIRNAYGRCKVFIALSDEWKEKLALIVPEEKIVVIENYCIIPKAPGREKNQILFLGEIGERKGCFDIPSIYAEILKSEKAVPMVMCGDGETEKVKRLLNEKGVTEGVSFPGWVRGEEKDRLLRESSVFLFPSYNEGMPMALLEAMAYGLAVVTTDVGGIPRLIDHGRNGYLCKPGDIQDLAEKVSELLQDDERRNKFGDAARERAMTQYSLERHMEKLFALYRKLLGR